MAGCNPNELPCDALNLVLHTKNMESQPRSLSLSTVAKIQLKMFTDPPRQQPEFP